MLIYTLHSCVNMPPHIYEDGTAFYSKEDKCDNFGFGLRVETDSQKYLSVQQSYNSTSTRIYIHIYSKIKYYT